MTTVIESCYIHNDGPHEYKCDQTIRKHYLWTVLDRWKQMDLQSWITKFSQYWEYYRWSFISISRNGEWFEDHYWRMKSDKLIWYAIRVVILIRTFVWFFSLMRNRLFLVWCWYLSPLGLMVWDRSIVLLFIIE